MKSIRATTTWLTFFGVSLLGFALCGSTYWIAREALLEQFDQDLSLEFQSLASVSRVWPDGDFYVDLDFDVATQYNHGGTRLFQVWNETGDKVIDQSPLLEEVNQRLSYPPKPPGHDPYFYNLNLPDGTPARAVFQRIDAQWGWVEKQPDLVVDDSVERTAVQLLVVRERKSLDSALSLLQRWSLAIAGLLPALCFLVVRSTVGRGIQPLGQLAGEVDAIRTSSEQLSPPATWPREISPVVETLNALLDRLEQHLKRERRFTADVAHELRTPLAELRTATDIALYIRAAQLPDSTWDDIDAQRAERLLNAVKQANQLSHSMADLVNAMLLLARFQSGQSVPERKPVRVDRLVAQHIESLRTRAEQRSLRLDTTIPEEITTETDQGLLTIILANLIGNAVAHAPPYSSVALCLRPAGTSFDLTLTNPAPSLEQADLAQLFEPFWRKGASRSERDHYGLGLAITREACLSLDLSLKADLDNRHTLTITLSSG
ncbi:sensor histidine kinase [Marinobacter nanhaiticus D15-8W]|uniref:histidine kinase n=1 Tax=Marinobacter nanhaiticus D15-8W TaxID=626887 RepID=N6X3Y3_9GAMM|nr:ATP-binding protein [Marinobacter nanhaiticus]ENO15768.1 two-component sensor histidine kinase [Marinobacter nanhaiticus D15-8W]BES73374.1 sensor histidine kinase [Marinobacter nanhaiticus D15-8W]